jgi:Uncharacterised protein family (UPF0158)
MTPLVVNPFWAGLCHEERIMPSEVHLPPSAGSEEASSPAVDPPDVPAAPDGPLYEAPSGVAAAVAEQQTKVDSLSPLAAIPSGPVPLIREDLDAAYGVLVAAVQALQQRGRRPVAAGVKSEMQRLSAGGFLEGSFGFGTFRSFLDAAAAEGRVLLVQAPRGTGQDIELLLPGQPAPAHTPARQRVRKAQRIRHDLWRAFVDWNPDSVRIYDRARGKARCFPREPKPLEPPDVTELRRRWQSDPDAFPRITPISRETQLGWMRQFVDHEVTDQASQEVLRMALNRPDRPETAFAQAVRVASVESERWNSFRAGRVRGVIERWLRDHNIVDDLDASDEPVATSSAVSRESVRRVPGPPEPPMPRSTPDYDLRGALLSVLGRMSTDELLQLKVPIYYTLRP